MTTIERPVADPRELPDALADLWRQLQAADDTPICRALTANLIAVTAAAHEDQLESALERLLLRHPCRAFVVVLGADGDGVQADVSAGVRCEHGSRQTELERIRLRTSRRAFARIPSIIRPLLVNDLPVHLYWAAALPENTWELQTMARLADQTIVESCRFADPIGDLQRLQGLQDGPFVDLAEFRLRPWRRALAEAFEQIAWRAEAPTEVTIVHGDACGAVAASYSLSRWLLDKLRAATELRATDDAAAPDGEPQRLELRHGDAHVAVEHLPNECKLRTTVTLADRCLLPYVTPASRGRVGDLLAAAVDRV